MKAGEIEDTETLEDGISELADMRGARGEKFCCYGTEKRRAYISGRELLLGGFVCNETSHAISENYFSGEEEHQLLSPESVCNNGISARV